MKIKNDRKAIDERIGFVLKQLKPGSARDFIDRVYRPFCYILSETAMNGRESPPELIGGIVCLVANMLNEVGHAAARDPAEPGKLTNLMLADIGQMIEASRQSNQERSIQ
jgi:hypothetical protein